MSDIKRDTDENELRLELPFTMSRLFSGEIPSYDTKLRRTLLRFRLLLKHAQSGDLS